MFALKRLFQEDQRDREERSRVPEDDRDRAMGELMARDKDRLQEVRRLLEAGEVKTGQDFLFAAMIYQHNHPPENFAMAYLLALRAHEMGYDPKGDEPHPLWLAAAAKDRWLVSLNLPQDFGTQWQIMADGSKERFPVNPKITDEERIKWQVPPLRP